LRECARARRRNARRERDLLTGLRRVGRGRQSALVAGTRTYAGTIVEGALGAAWNFSVVEPGTLTEEESKLAVTPEGRPVMRDASKSTVPLKPLTGNTLMVDEAE